MDMTKLVKSIILVFVLASACVPGVEGIFCYEGTNAKWRLRACHGSCIFIKTRSDLHKYHYSCGASVHKEECQRGKIFPVICYCNTSRCNGRYIPP